MVVPRKEDQTKPTPDPSPRAPRRLRLDWMANRSTEGSRPKPRQTTHGYPRQSHDPNILRPKRRRGSLQIGSKRGGQSTRLG